MHAQHAVTVFKQRLGICATASDAHGVERFTGEAEESHGGNRIAGGKRGEFDAGRASLGERLQQAVGGVEVDGAGD